MALWSCCSLARSVSEGSPRVPCPSLWSHSERSSDMAHMTGARSCITHLTGGCRLEASAEQTMVRYETSWTLGSSKRCLKVEKLSSSGHVALTGSQLQMQNATLICRMDSCDFVASVLINNFGLDVQQLLLCTAVCFNLTFSLFSAFDKRRQTPFIVVIAGDASYLKKSFLKSPDIISQMFQHLYFNDVQVFSKQAGSIGSCLERSTNACYVIILIRKGLPIDQ